MRTTIVIGMMALLASVASANMLTIDITYGGGNFTVDATVSDAGNGGLKAFSIDFGSDVTSLVNDTHKGTVADAGFANFESVGFSDVREPGGSYTDILSAGQNGLATAVRTPIAAFQVYHVGQLGSSPVTYTPPTGWSWAGPAIPALSAPYQLGHGTYSGATMDMTDLDAYSASLYDTDSGVSAHAPGSIVVNFIPEPATMSILAIGGLGILLRRRR